MSVWPSQPGKLSRRHSFAIRATRARAVRPSRIQSRVALWVGCLICILVAQGVAITQSYLWAAPLSCLLLVAVATDLPLVPFIGLLLLTRVLTDDLSSSTSRHSGSVNLSAAIAALYILVAVGLLLRRRQAIWPAVLATLWLCLWTAIAVRTHGASVVTLREGVREASIVALAVIVCNSRGVLNLSLVTRLIQLAGIASALLALYQLATHTGQLVGGEIRSNGTFSQPNSAAVFFAVATTVSLWRFVDDGRRRTDAFFAAIYAVAAIATFSLGGLACLLVMLITFGLLRPGPLRPKLGSCAVAGLIVVAFLATPLGAERIASESSISRHSNGAGGTTNSSLAWRLNKWQSLIPEWEKSPILGRGLGTTVTAEGTSEDTSAGELPHSEYVRYLVETGVVGLITILSGVFILLLRMARRRAIPGTRNAGTLGMAVVVGLLVNAIAANTLLYTPAAYAAALVVAAVLSSSAGAGSARGGRTRTLRQTSSLNHAGDAVLSKA
jgi:O-antigen ligase